MTDDRYDLAAELDEAWYWLTVQQQKKAATWKRYVSSAGYRSRWAERITSSTESTATGGSR